jgi:hypothetical protein
MALARDIALSCGSQGSVFSVLKEVTSRIFSIESREMDADESERDVHSIGPRKALAGLQVCR